MTNVLILGAAGQWTCYLLLDTTVRLLRGYKADEAHCYRLTFSGSGQGHWTCYLQLDIKSSII
jgi:hypothetical protein